MTTIRNRITDVPGILVGNAHDAAIASGVTVALLAQPVTVACAVLGGAPGSRETELTKSGRLASGADAIVLSGGSAYGLDAASGVQAWLRQHGRGLRVGPALVPLVPQAVSFDLLNGGDKDWGLYPPYRELGHAAAEAAAADFALGTAGGGYGATTVNLKGGLGSASTVAPSGFVVGALVVVNAIASAIVGEGPHFWAAPYEENAEFGGRGCPGHFDARTRQLDWKGRGQFATTIALVATDAALDRNQTHRLAIAAHGGLHKGLRFAHALMDGDTVFAAATGRSPRPVDVDAVIEITALAGDCLARAIARGVYEAKALPFPGALPAWKDRFG